MVLYFATVLCSPVVIRHELIQRKSALKSAELISDPDYKGVWEKSNDQEGENHGYLFFAQEGLQN
jgi:hypothetical protein